MKIKTILLATFSFSLSLGAFSQVFSENVVGYYILSIRAGENLIANQLHSSDDRLSNLFSIAIPNGSTATKWDGVSQQYLPLSYYSEGVGWSINYDLAVGQGILFTTASVFTNTFVGEVHGYRPDGIIFEHPAAGIGTFLLACSVPYGQAGFDTIVGRDPLESESVRRLNPNAQQYSTTTFVNGTWDNGAPVLDVGEAAFFTLTAPTAQAVPEPAVTTLLLGGIALFGASRFASRKSK